jgi:hypothetical protein
MSKKADEISERDFFQHTRKFLSIGNYLVDYEVISDYMFRGEKCENREWRITACNENTNPEAFALHLKDLLNNDLEIFISCLKSIDSKTQESILYNQIDLIINFRNTNFVSDTYNDIFDPPSFHVFKRFKSVNITNTDPFLLEGIDDDFGEKNYSLKRQLLWKGQAFALKAVETLDYYIRKLEHTSNNLYLIGLSKKLNNQSRHTQFSFEYKHIATEPANVTDFFHALKDEKLIDDSTKLSSFKIIFSRKEVIEPIIWTGSIGALHFIMKTLNGQSKLNLGGNGLWEITAYCFVKPGKKSFNKNQLRKAKVPENTTRLLNMCYNL